MNADDRLVARLLAGEDRLSRIEKDAALAGALATVTPPHRVRWPWLAVPAIAAVVALLAIGPWREPEFAARGGASSAVVLHASCAGGCTHGAKLVFDLHGTVGYRYFAAFAKRGDTVLWYFPSTDTETSSALPTSGILDRAIVLGDDHPPGVYRVYGVFSVAPLTRAQIRDAFDPARRTAGEHTQVVTIDVEVR